MDHLIILAKGKLEKSMVVDNELGQSNESEDRTSSGMFLHMAQDEVVADIEGRIATWTFLPVENGEPCRYCTMNMVKYEPHVDYFYDKVNLELAGHRIATVLMYLSDVESGGETVFPNSEVTFAGESRFPSVCCFFYLCLLSSYPAIVTAIVTFRGEQNSFGFF
ncbi:putative prolyl 4-hydroxylase 4 [Hibiscus syriacus]|uniref:Prolyl 4-hydroxylase 4 n=1 Tax=Hibiscus syriacus TaxID=106335 RepID=A0A6A3BMK9_HIBSY|nr:putative prolyl 4-hydroxylase 4 [Hibiscus syriacus]